MLLSDLQSIFYLSILFDLCNCSSRRVSVRILVLQPRKLWSREAKGLVGRSPRCKVRAGESHRLEDSHRQVSLPTAMLSPSTALFDQAQSWNNLIQSLVLKGIMLCFNQRRLWQLGLTALVSLANSGELSV